MQVWRVLALLMATVMLGCASTPSGTGEDAEAAAAAVESISVGELVVTTKAKPPEGEGTVADIVATAISDSSAEITLLPDSSLAAGTYAWGVFGGPCGSDAKLVGDPTSYPGIEIVGEAVPAGATTWLRESLPQETASVRIFYEDLNQAEAGCASLNLLDLQGLAQNDALGKPQPDGI